MKSDAPPERGPRAQQKAATAKAILEAARDEFEAVGFDGANLRAIGARAGVTAGTVLHHFHDKRDLLYATLDASLAHTLELALAEPDPGDLLGRLSALTRAVYAFYLERPALSRALLKESLFADGAWRAHFNAQTASVHVHVAAWVQAAQEAGRLSPSLDPQLVGAAYLSFFYFALLGWAQGAIQAPAAFVDRLIAQHLGLAETTPMASKQGRKP